MASPEGPLAQPAPGSRPESALSISQLNRAARALLEEGFRAPWLRGEISRFKAYGSGHWYFTLKDDEASVSAVMFRGANRSCRVKPTDGLEVVVRGRVSLYEPRGQFQVIVEHLEPAGEGALWLAFEKLKKKLDEEGLFAPERKRSLPLLPRRIGVATSLDGAALRDVLRVLETRGARLSIVLAGCRVQGQGAAEEVAEALRRLDALGDLDAIIVGRGGGSLEDLWAFNEEVVARAIAAVRVPVISAVGHEIDTTIADLVADVRAATPSQAAELVSASAAEIGDRVRGLLLRLRHAARAAAQSGRVRLARARPDRLALVLRHRVERAAQHVDALSARAVRAVLHELRRARDRQAALARRLAPAQLLAGARRRRQRLEERDAALVAAARRRVTLARERLRSLDRQLAALSPLAVLERGYAVLLTEDGRVVRRCADAAEGQALEARLAADDRLGLVVRSRREGGQEG